jgi:hypothetical protein
MHVMPVVINIYQKSQVSKNSVHTTFCFKLSKTATETYEMLDPAIQAETMSRTQTFYQFSKFKIGLISCNKAVYSGHP